ncbi:MAG TPA: hypothetical protein VL100_07410 [Croceibacterium sp.]|nr:hypothetical protein [Croceibacterium sp.]
MIRKILLALSAIAASVAHPAMAETLPVGGVYPAGSDAAAAVQSIAVEPFGGIDGQTLAIALGDELRAVSIGGTPYFRVVPGGRAAEAEATLQGTLSVERSRRDSYDKEREECVERDKDDKCTKREKRKIPCWEAVVRIDPSIRLIDPDGMLLDAFDEPRESATRYCRDDRRPSQDDMIRQLTQALARDLRFRFAPVERVEDIRVMEDRNGLANADKDRFRDALRLTKQDGRLACDAFHALEGTNAGHPSVLFNLGLCAESAGDLAAAEDYYRRTLAANAKADYAGMGLRRIADRHRADAQLAEHNAI